MKRTYFITCASFIFLCCFWELASLHFVEYRYILPSISSIFARIWKGSDLFIANSKVTIREMAGGFALALVIAFPLAWAMYLWKSTRAIIQPLFIIIQSVPMFTLAPIMVLWFGWSYIAIIIPTALMIFLPLTMNIYQGLMSTPKGLLEFFKINQATSWQTFSKLQFPWSLPHVFAGFRISAAFAGIGAIAGEWAGAQSGLGVLMLKSRRALDLETTFGALFCLIFISMVLYGFIAYSEMRYKQKKPMKLFSFGLIFCLLAMVTFISSAVSPPNAEKHVMRLLLDWLPNSNHVPLYAGIKKQIFAKHNINLQVVEFNEPSDTVPLLTSGVVDIALFYLPDVVSMSKKGVKLKIAGVLIEEPLNSIIFRSDKKIDSPQDLSGKVIGYSTTGSFPDILDRLLKINHIVPKDLRNANFDLVTLLGTFQIDAVYGAFWNIEGEHLKSLNIPTSHFDICQLGYPHYSELVFIGIGDPMKFDVFKQAMQESIDYCKNNPEEAFDLYVHCHPEKNSQTIAWERNAWLKTLPLLAKTQSISEEEWERLRKWFDEE